ncbi:MAG: Dam family site-specific DNA-(adenine-N6)-methyltransferase [Acidobacteria bacterium]|nr:Dam family site-specific DNA-(adenine-N6)-methyltransferase [Acidobacteriota bacterium]
MKWAGGKRQLLPALRRYYPTDFRRYIEPFTGSGAVFFDLYASGRLKGRGARLADVNPDLIGCYRTVRDHTEAVIEALATLEAEHYKRGDDCYYEVRDQRFNPARVTRTPGDPAVADRYTPELAAMLIYLNRTGFNGLFRLNRRGEYNVPVGRYTNPHICDAAHIRSVARAFSLSGVSLECTPFERVLAGAGDGDFVYCDPPYAPLTRTAAFAHYTAGGFDGEDQTRLQQAVLAAARRGAVVVLSNSSAPEIVTAYGSRQARAAGLTVEYVPARRAINSRSALRGPVDELIVTNARALSKLRMARGSLPAMLNSGAVTMDAPRKRA